MARVRWKTIVGVVLAYLLAALASGLVIHTLSLPVVQRGLSRLFWSCSPLRACAYPFDHESGAFRLSLSDELTTVILLVGGLLVFIAAAQTIMFGVALTLYARFGWPPYWKEVGPRLDQLALLARSAWRGWWVWPVGLLLWCLLATADRVFFGAGYSIADTSSGYGTVYFATLWLIYLLMSARVLRTAVVAALGPDDLRCLGCGYLLRGLVGPRCPECGGDASQPQASRFFRLCLWRGRRAGRPGWLRRALPFTIVAALLLVPVWLPRILAQLPPPWLAYFPASIRPSYAFLNRTPLGYPIRLNSVCLLRHNNAVGVIQLASRQAFRADYRALRWSDAEQFVQRRPPEEDLTGELRVIDYTMPPPLKRWNLQFRSYSAELFWVSLPDATYSLETYDPNDAPADVNWALQPPP